MLIEFSVANFMSIKERQTFSLVASKSTELADTHTFDAPIATGKNPIRLLRSAAIYGANASGKTNLLIALSVMAEMVAKSAGEKVRGDPVTVKPFMLDAKTRKAPSEFEVQFIAEGVRYQYGFSATRERVMAEWLIAYPRNRAQRWFERTWSSDKREYEWEFGAFLTGEKNLWKKSTRNNALFLSTAVQLNSRQLQPVHDWFTNDTYFRGAPGLFHNLGSSLHEKGNKEKVLDFLKVADLGIDGLHVKKEEFNLDELPADMPEYLQQFILKEMEGKPVYEIAAVHTDTDGSPVKFDFGDESAGTQRMLSFAGSWIEALEKGHMIFIDELHGHLHLKLVKYLVQLFHNNKTNPRNAQLVFTTHETALLNQEIMRRDQIWFCEKNKQGETAVYPLTDFHPRKGRENLELGYLSGAYGALPYIREA